MTNPRHDLPSRPRQSRPRCRPPRDRAGLAGADDGELFLEYGQTEALVFDNGRLKQATYDTSQGFGLRAVKDDAVGYAHSSDVSLPALIRAADAVAAVRGGYSRESFAAAPAHTNVRLYGDDNPLDAPGFEAKVKLLAEIDAYAARQGSAGAAGFRSASAPPGRWWKSCAPTARAIATSARWCGSIFRWSPAKATGRKAAARVMAAAKAMRASSRPRRGARRPTAPIREALVNLESVPAPAGEMDVVLGAGWPGVMLHEAVGHGLEGDFNRKQTSAFAGLMGQQVAAKGVTVVDDGTMAVAARFALHRRRGHADQPHRADRGRHSGRLHAGPPERAADEHEADRQRPPAELRPRADAAHDQHLHAGGPAATRRKSSPR